MKKTMRYRNRGIIGGAAALCLAAGVGACVIDITKGHLGWDAGPDDSLEDDWIYEAIVEDGPEDAADSAVDEGPDVSGETTRDIETREDLDAIDEALGDVILEERTDLPNTDAEEPAVECSGVLVGGYCWYVSEMDGSCTAACVLHGGCNLAGTRDYAGSGGTDAQCIAVLDALGYGTDIYPHQSFANDDFGCHFAWGTWTYWATMYETTCEAFPIITGPDPSVFRMCACER